MSDLIREAPIGQIIRYISGNKYLQYPEEKPDFHLPQEWIDRINSDSTAPSPASASDDEDTTVRPVSDAETDAIEKTTSVPIVPQKTKDGAVLVDWYRTDDAADPHQWSNAKRMGVTLIICLYTFVVYTSSAIYTSSTQGIMEQFGVSQLKASLGLSLYVLGYGVGPLVFSPLSEIPRIGRNPVYIITMFLFVILSIPTAFAPNFAGLMVLRFLQGFFGSPCLASGGASIGDMYSLLSLPYAMMAWVSAAYCGRKFFFSSQARVLSSHARLPFCNLCSPS